MYRLIVLDDDLVDIYYVIFEMILFQLIFDCIFMLEILRRNYGDFKKYLELQR